MDREIARRVVECTTELEKRADRMLSYSRNVLLGGFLAMIISYFLETYLIYAVMFIWLLFFFLTEIILGGQRIHFLLENILMETHPFELQEYRDSTVLVGSYSSLLFFMRRHEFTETYYKTLQNAYYRYNSVSILAMLLPLIGITFSAIATRILMSLSGI